MGEINNKFITSRSFLSSDIVPTSSEAKESDGLLYTVTRYGPREPAEGVNLLKFLVPKL